VITFEVPIGTQGWDKDWHPQSRMVSLLISDHLFVMSINGLLNAFSIFCYTLDTYLWSRCT